MLVGDTMVDSSYFKTHWTKPYLKLTMGGEGLTDQWHMMTTVRHDVATTLNFIFTFVTSCIGIDIKLATTMHFHEIHHNSHLKSSNTLPDIRESREQTLGLIGAI